MQATQDTMQDAALVPTFPPDQTPQDTARAAFTAWASADPDRIARLLASPLGQARRGKDRAETKEAAG